MSFGVRAEDGSGSNPVAEHRDERRRVLLRKPPSPPVAVASGMGKKPPLALQKVWDQGQTCSPDRDRLSTTA
jgi:hypothetical protein